MDGMTLRGVGPEGFVAELAEHAAEVDRDARFPWESLEALHAEGLLALTARPEDGGQAATLAQAVQLVRAAGRGCASTALVFAMQLIHLRVSTAWASPVREQVGRSAGRFGP